MAEPIGNVTRLLPGLIERVNPSANQPASSIGKADGSFGDMLSSFVDGVNNLHHESADIQQAFMSGEPVELHEVMVKAEEAGIATELLIEIRNKLMDAYSQLIKMPV